MSQELSPPQELERYSAFLRQVARNLVGDGQADDLVQDTLLVGLQKGPRDERRLRGWLRRVCLNLFLQRKREEASRVRREEKTARQEAVPSTVESVEHRAAVLSLTEAVTSLGEPEYTVIRLRYFDGLMPREIAARTGERVEVVKRNLERARSRLKSILSRDSHWKTSLAPLAGIAFRGAAETMAATSSVAVVGTSSGTLSSLSLGGALMFKNVALIFTVVALALGMYWFVLRDSEMVAPDGLDDARQVTGASRTGGSDQDGEDKQPIETRTFVPGEEEAGSSSPIQKVDRDLDVFGEVVDTSGKAVPGADIFTVRFPWRRVSTLNSEGYAEEKVVGRAKTNVEGRFVLRHRRGDLVDIRVKARGFATKTVKHCLAGGRNRIVLEQAAPFTVVVVDQDGGPTSGVLVHFWKRETDAPRPSTYDHRRGKTDARGRWKVGDVAPGTGTLDLDHAGLGSPGWQTIVLEPGRENVFNFTMPPGRSIRGRVTDSLTGRPILGAHVGESWARDRCVKTDGDGRYVFHGWTGMGIKDLHASAEGYGRTARLVPEGGELDFALVPGDAVEGRIVDASGNPVPAALVTAVGSVWGGFMQVQDVDSMSSVSDAEGAFRLTDLRRDMPHTLVVQVRGFGRLLLDFDPYPEKPGTIELGDIPLHAARAIEGRVVIGKGAPAVRAAVILTGFNHDRFRLRDPGRVVATHTYARTEERRTDDLGRFRFPDLSPGSYKVTVMCNDRPPMSQEVVLPADEDIRDLVFGFTDALPLLVRVLDETGRPVADLDVRARPEGASRSVKRTTDGEGRARFLGIPPKAELRLDFSVWELPYLEPEDAEYENDGQEIVITLKRAALITGQVVDESENPVQGMIVDAESDGYGTSATSRADGSFRLKLAPGKIVDLTVRGSRITPGHTMGTSTPYRGKVENVAAPSEGVRIKLTRLASDRTLTVLVTDPQGKPVPGATLWVTSAGKTRRPKTGADGTTRIEGLASQEVHLIAVPPEGAGYVSGRARVVPEGQKITIAFREPTIITGVVLDDAGKPAANARVEALTGEFDGLAVIADAQGRFRIAVARGQAYVVTATSRDPLTNKRYVAVAKDISGGTLTLRLKLRP